MGLYTNYAFAIAPGLGINAVAAFSLVGGEGCGHDDLRPDRPAREGDGRDPARLKKAIAIGIGLFIAFISAVVWAFSLFMGAAFALYFLVPFLQDTLDWI